MTSPNPRGPEKIEEEAQFVETPEDGFIDWLSRLRKHATVEGNKILEAVGSVVRDRCCGCPATSPDAGMCRPGKRRLCSTHAAWCSACGLPCCQRHRILVNGLPVCAKCYTPAESPNWILFLVLVLFVLLFLGSIMGRR
jgi:hypothetical protein